MTVLAAQRRELILEQVRRSGAARVSDLTQKLGVSDMTIRRDLEFLAQHGLIEKVHGGATATSSTHEAGFTVKSSLEQDEKRAIARVAVEFVEAGMAVGLSAGTTTWTLAGQLHRIPGLTLVTNSMEVASVLHEGSRGDQTVVLTGGVRTRSGALVGPVAVNSLRGLNLDLVFMGVHGMDADAGFTSPNMMEADTNRALVAAGRRMVVVTDSTKWGSVGVSTFAELNEADVVVTDGSLSVRARRILTERVGELVLAPTLESEPSGPDEEAAHDKAGDDKAGDHGAADDGAADAGAADDGAADAGAGNAGAGGDGAGAHGAARRRRPPAD